jgi:serine protease AprX
MLPLIASPALAGKPPKGDPPPAASPSPNFKSVETAGGYLPSGSSLDIAVPADVAAGDFLIAQIAYNANGTITPPAGWTTIDVVNHSSRPIMQGLYWREATADEPASYPFALASGKYDTVSGAIAAYSNIDMADPIDAFGGQENGTSTSIVAPSINTSVSNTILIGFFSVRDNGAITPPADLAEHWNHFSAGGVGAIGETVALGADTTFAELGGTGTRTATAEVSDGSIGHLVALKPSTSTSEPTEPYVQWEDAAALQGLPPGQYSGSMPWITNNITNADVFWNAGYDGSGIDVALIDTGVVPVDGLTWPGKVINGPDLSFESQADNLRYLDTYGHGTHLAGIIAGRDDADTNFSGMAPGARIVNVKVAGGQGAVDVSQVIAAIDWVVQHRNDNGMNIKVITLAYGTDSVQPYQVDPLAYAVEKAWNAGIVVVVAAGNDGNAALLRNPATDPFVIAVGAAENNSSQISGVASFSNCGSSERFVDIVAPGRSVLSLRAPGSWADQHYPDAAVDGTYFLGSGTSQAAAVVAGAVALLLDMHPDLTPDQVKSMMTTKADYVSGADYQCQGAGSLDMSGLTKLRVPSVKSAEQTFEPSDGSGSLEAARGSNHVYDEGVQLTGEYDIMSSPWVGPAAWIPCGTAETSTAFPGAGSRGAGSRGAGSRGAGSRGAGSHGVACPGAARRGLTQPGTVFPGAGCRGVASRGAVSHGAATAGPVSVGTALFHVSSSR